MRSYENAEKFTTSIPGGDAFSLPAREGGNALFHLANENKRGLSYLGIRASFLRIQQVLAPSSPLCTRDEAVKARILEEVAS